MLNVNRFTIMLNVNRFTIMLNVNRFTIMYYCVIYLLDNKKNQ